MEVVSDVWSVEVGRALCVEVVSDAVCGGGEGAVCGSVSDVCEWGRYCVWKWGGYCG